MSHDAPRVRRLLFSSLAIASFIACSGADRAPFAETSPPGADAGSGEEGVGKTDGGKTPRDGGSSGTDPGSDSSTATDADPEATGPFSVGEASGTRGGIAMHAFFPKTGDKAPVVVFAHGFQLPPSQYDAPLKHLASHGYVALTADYKASITGGNDNATQAKSLSLGFDWAKDDPTVGPHVDVSLAGTSGHSLGGKLALLAATQDSRVKASIVLDPVDGNGVVVADLLPDLQIPTGFLGETLDSAVGFGGQACAPKNANFETFYAKANSPSLRVTIDGASHMSFIDDIASCGFPCSACKSATTPADDVAKIPRGYLVAFFQRHLRGLTAYDAYLTRATDLTTIKTK